MKKPIIGNQSVIVNAILSMSANPTHHKGRRPSAESARTNVIFIFDFTIVFNNYFYVHHNIKKIHLYTL